MSAATESPARRRLNVGAFYRMAEAGIIGPDERVELIDGEVIDMAPIGEDQAATVTGLTERLVLAFAGRAVVSVQNPVRLDGFNEPEPDVAICRLRPDCHRAGHPAAADILAVIEVADTSLRFDRAVKLPLYARAGVAEFWIVDLKRRSVDVHRSPAGETYAEQSSYGSSDRIALLLAPEVEIELDGILD